MSFSFGAVFVLIREDTRKVGRSEFQKLENFAIYVKDAFYLSVYTRSVFIGNNGPKMMRKINRKSFLGNFFNFL